jgi:hypothetical protein
MYEDQSLESLAKKIAENVKQADEFINQADQRVIEAAQMLVEVKERVDQDDAVDISWYDWAKTHIGLNKTRLDELHSIGSAGDPLARAREIRELAKARAQRHRGKKKAIPLRNGEESKTEGTAVPAAETESGAPAPDKGQNSEPERDSDTARDIQSPLESALDESNSPPEAVESHSAEDKERAELISKFTAWAKTANIDELRSKVMNIVGPLAIPGFLDRRQKQDAA